MNTPRCWSCDGCNWRASYRFGEYQLFICQNCGVGYLAGPLPAPESFYDPSYYASDDPERGYAAYAALVPGLRKTFSQRLARIERFLGRPGRLLDVGCGLGTALAVAHERGWHAEGLEVAPATVAWLRSHGYSVQEGRVEQLTASEAYDCITLWDTLEHVTDPLLAVQAVARALRPGGVLALTTGDRASLCAKLSGPRWHLFNIPEHRFFFTPPAVRMLLTRAGVRLLSLRHRGSWYPLRYLAERLERKYALRIPLPTAWRDALLFVNLFDIMEVHARKER